MKRTAPSSERVFRPQCPAPKTNPMRKVPPLLDVVPIDVMQHVFVSFSKTGDILSLAQTCKALHFVSQSDAVLGRLFRLIFINSPRIVPNESFSREFAIQRRWIENLQRGLYASQVIDIKEKACCFAWAGTSHIVTGHPDGSIKIFNLEKGEGLQIKHFSVEVKFLVCGDGTGVAVSVDNEGILFSLGTGEIFRAIHQVKEESSVSAVKFTDGRFLLCYEDPPLPNREVPCNIVVLDPELRQHSATLPAGSRCSDMALCGDTLFWVNSNCGTTKAYNLVTQKADSLPGFRSISWDPESKIAVMDERMAFVCGKKNPRIFSWDVGNRCRGPKITLWDQESGIPYGFQGKWNQDSKERDCSTKELGFLFNAFGGIQFDHYHPHGMNHIMTPAPLGANRPSFIFNYGRLSCFCLERKGIFYADFTASNEAILESLSAILDKEGDPSLRRVKKVLSRMPEGTRQAINEIFCAASSSQKEQKPLERIIPGVPTLNQEELENLIPNLERIIPGVSQLNQEELGNLIAELLPAGVGVPPRDDSKEAPPPILRESVLLAQAIRKYLEGLSARSNLQ